MALKISSGLRDALLVTGSMKSTLDGCVLKMYSGTPPAAANDAVPGGATLLVTITDSPNVDDLLWEATVSNGALVKDTSQTWEGTVAETGVASWFRIVTTADDGTLSTTAVRVQGTVGTAGADLIMASVSLTAAATQSLGYGNITIPLTL